MTICLPRFVRQTCNANSMVMDLVGVGCLVLIDNTTFVVTYGFEFVMLSNR